tara:strand:+ start:1131 stop:1862 length:732 start_codon:yes stop_codon:yes gene_type:complete
MAVNIDNVYQKVLALANKEQRGYITPQEFNLFADRAQNEIFDNYFHGFKMAQRKPTDQMLYADEVEMLEEKLHPFHIDTTVAVTAATLALPSIHKIISITRANGTQLSQLNKTQITFTEGNPLTKAVLTRSVFVREDSGSLTIYPAASSATWNLDTNSDGENDAEGFEVSYYSAPSTPNWGYVVAGEKALYNASTSVNFQLHVGEEENLVSRILMLAGVTIQKPEIQQAGMQDIQLMKQQQNS